MQVFLFYYLFHFLVPYYISFCYDICFSSVFIPFFVKGLTIFFCCFCNVVEKRMSKTEQIRTFELYKNVT